MSKVSRSVPSANNTVTFKSTREVALDAALTLLTGYTIHEVGTYSGKSRAEELVAEAAIIEAYLDKD